MHLRHEFRTVWPDRNQWWPRQDNRISRGRVLEIVNKIVDAREAIGVMNAETAGEGRIRAVKEDDGVNVIAKVFWDIVLTTKKAS